MTYAVLEFWGIEVLRGNPPPVFIGLMHRLSWDAEGPGFEPSRRATSIEQGLFTDVGKALSTRNNPVLMDEN